MAATLVTVQHYRSLDELERAREILEDAGMNPFALEEARGEGEGVYALQVPEDDAERAEELLENALPPEEAEAMDTLNDLEQESDELQDEYEHFQTEPE